MSMVTGILATLLDAQVPIVALTRLKYDAFFTLIFIVFLSIFHQKNLDIPGISRARLRKCGVVSVLTQHSPVYAVIAAQQVPITQR